MKEYRDIQHALLDHVACGSGVAARLRHHNPYVVTALRRFFDAAGDVERLDASQRVATLILNINDMEEMAILRDAVAFNELTRRVGYEKQRDHTAHTLLLYLLGVWFIDNVPRVREGYRDQCGGIGPNKLADRFLLQWLFAALLHDIGYVFSDLDDRTLAGRELVCEFFESDHIRRLYKGRPKKPLERFLRVHTEWENAYSIPLRENLLQDDPVSILRVLASAPWLGDLRKDWQDKDIFDVFDPGDVGGSLLREYAFHIAKNGYKASPGNGQADHAIVSGLLLFRYSSYWYWLLNRMNRSDGQALTASPYRTFNYSPEILWRDILPACRACAYHNILESTYERESVLRDRTSLEADTLTFLSVLCDEVQKWDRFPSGAAHFKDYRKYASRALSGTFIELRCDGLWESAIGRLVIHKRTREIGEMNKALALRCKGAEQVVHVTGNDDYAGVLTPKRWDRLLAECRTEKRKAGGKGRRRQEQERLS